MLSKHDTKHLIAGTYYFSLREQELYKDLGDAGPNHPQGYRIMRPVGGGPRVVNPDKLRQNAPAWFYDGPEAIKKKVGEMLHAESKRQDIFTELLPDSFIRLDPTIAKVVAGIVGEINSQWGKHVKARKQSKKGKNVEGYQA